MVICIQAFDEHVIYIDLHCFTNEVGEYFVDKL